MNLSLSWQQRKDILWAPSSHQIMLRYNTMLDWLTYKIIFGDPRLLRYSILQIVCSCPSAMKNAGKVLTLHIFPRFTLGTIHKVLQHFFSDFWHPPPPCQQQSAFQYPLPKKYVSICQIRNWPIKTLEYCQKVFEFWICM